MPEAWDLVPDTGRTADSLTTFIIFCEDEVNEPCYFRTFEIKNRLKVNAVDDQKSNFRNIERTLQYCEETGLLDATIGHYQLKPGTTNHVWSVFDRDAGAENPADIAPKENISFNSSIQLARNAGIQVAWSNDVFELWVLLHFEDLPPGIWRHRSYIYDRLTAVFQQLPDQPPEMVALTSRDNFRYDSFFKRKRHFIQFVLPYLKPRTQQAIKRAQQLEVAFTPTQRFHERNPCTGVHHLVLSLLSFDA